MSETGGRYCVIYNSATVGKKSYLSDRFAKRENADHDAKVRNRTAGMGGFFSVHECAKLGWEARREFGLLPTSKESVHHATKKSPGQLQREIDTTLAKALGARRHHVTRRDASAVTLVGRDALLEGSPKAHATAIKLADEFRAENFEGALQAYADALTANAAKYVVWTDTGRPMVRFVIDPKYKGKRYARILSADIGMDGTLRPPGSIHSFVDLASGAIYKPKNGTSPNLNFARGSIYDLANAPTASVHGL